MNIKKIIKGIIGIGTVGGIAYAAYKLGECNGEVNERMCEKYGDEDENGIGSDDDEDDFRFYDNMDKPDDGCLAPASVAVIPYDIGNEHTISKVGSAKKCEVPVELSQKEKPLSQKENKECVKAEVAPLPVRKFPRLKDFGYIYGLNLSRNKVEDLLIWMIRVGSFYKVDLTYELHAGDKKVNMIYDAFLKAGFIRKEENSRKTYCNITKEEFCELFLEK